MKRLRRVPQVPQRSPKLWLMHGMLGVLCKLTHSILTASFDMGLTYHHPYFIEGKTEAQRD